MANPSATIYAWAKTLNRCAEKDHNEKLKTFAQHLIESLHTTVDHEGYITRDLALHPSNDIPV